jgi:predicted nucleic acid-binding protein
MPARIFIDSNVCLYILDKHSPKHNVSKQLLQERPIISTQVVAENLNVCLKKFRLNKVESIRHANSLMQACEVRSTTKQTVNQALIFVEQFDYSVFDSLILASAYEAGCAILYTEDMQHGHFLNKKLKIINPFHEV